MLVLNAPARPRSLVATMIRWVSSLPVPLSSLGLCGPGVIREASEAREWTADLHERLELPRVHVLPVAGDVPAAREHETRSRRRVVEHRLGRSRGVPLDSARDEHDEYPVASRDGASDDVAVARGSATTRCAP